MAQELFKNCIKNILIMSVNIFLGFKYFAEIDYLCYYPQDFLAEVSLYTEVSLFQGVRIERFLI